MRFSKAVNVQDLWFTDIQKCIFHALYSKENWWQLLCLFLFLCPNYYIYHLSCINDGVEPNYGPWFTGRNCGGYYFVVLNANYCLPSDLHDLFHYELLRIVASLNVKVIYLCRCSKTQSHWPDYQLLARCWHLQWVLPRWRRLRWEQRQIRCSPLASLMSMGSCDAASKSKQSHVQDDVYMCPCLPDLPGACIFSKWIIGKPTCDLFTAVYWLVLYVVVSLV